MARINLLPWREQLREKRRKRFLTSLAAVAIGAIGIIILADRYYTSEIDAQAARNQFIQAEIAGLDNRIKQISDLKARRKQLVERMKIIQDLQGNRPISGRIFDQLARTLPDGVYFTDVKMVDKVISIAGNAESNNRVSELLRNLESSPWLEQAVLTEVKTKPSGDVDQANAFQLTVRQTVPAEGEAK
ncbi:PilN domain-containing protein [Pseudomonas sp. HR96]|uniref:PilN domain-containing protein n=1 Tax=Pseudomonas sp. HR96 TaxID=1027966 RepID=UPI002A7650D6|nr:PilN domain-containing protein [Pseudomonas sp. HR96]WPO99607.1 PilN domain-containing protein [Pseudomonas sp. HR96]